MKLVIAVFLTAATLVAQTPEPKSIAPIGSFHDFRADSLKEDAGTVHYLALESSAESQKEAKAAGRVYSADERLGAPTGFYFAAVNNNGVYELGDHAPVLARTRLTAQTPVPAKLRILRGEEKVAEADGAEITYIATEPGAYRFESRMGEDRVWIQTSPIFLERTAGVGVALPPGDIAATVEVKKDITYVEGEEADANKHKLDLYLPKGKREFPVLVFLHGGSWRSGDRAMYPALGNRFAKEGIGVVVPSYRLMPGASHPAQVEDAAAAVDWVVRNIANYGGDAKRVYLSGHSAGGHLAAWVGLDARFRSKLKGVIALSGVYDVSTLPAFRAGDVDGSPMHRISAGAPPFLITYCQNDYPTLAAGARQFDAALRAAGVRTELVYVPGKNHISEIADVWRDDDPTARAVLRVVRGSGMP